ncbi:hypothetical protein G6F57_023700 [Rhizopus arrhizus]|nr:hypothetical protein G6F57_023700 [Rhizopus arrhizus]
MGPGHRVLPAHDVSGVETEFGHGRHQRGAGRSRGAVQLSVLDGQHPGKPEGTRACGAGQARPGIRPGLGIGRRAVPDPARFADGCAGAGDSR